VKAARSLVVTADEFGRSPGINAGVIAASRNSIVTSASALVRYPAAAEAAQLARQNPELAVGLKVDLGEWECRNGDWVRVREVVPEDDPQALDGEVRRQLATFRQLFGHDPTHLDSHQSVHHVGTVRGVMVGVARELEVPLRFFTPDVSVCTDFYGQTSRGEPYPEGITVNRLLAILETLPPGCTELICHPGVDDDAGAYSTERTIELDVLCDATVRAAVKALDIRLRTFRELRTDLPFFSAQSEPEMRRQGQAAYERQDYRSAELWFRRAAAAAGTRPWPWLWLARAQLRNGDLAGSRESADRALHLGGDWPAAVLHLADLDLREGLELDAAARLETLATNASTNGDMARALLRTLTRFSHPATAQGVADALGRRHGDDDVGRIVRAVTLWRAGDHAAARRLFSGQPRDIGPSAARAAAEFHLETDSPAEAWGVLRHQPGQAGDAPLLLSIAHGLRKAGDLTLAWECLERAVAADPGDRDARYWRDVVIGEVHVLSGGWRPVAPPVRHYRPTPNRVLHLVGKSLPHVQAGYSVRTSYVVRSQKEAGLDPHVVTLLGFPWDHGITEAGTCENVGGIDHYRLAVPEGTSARLDDRLAVNLRQLIDLTRRLRPAVLHAASDYRNALLANALGQAFGIPVVYEVRGFWEETWRSKRQDADPTQAAAYHWRRDRELACMLAATHVVTLADVMKGELIARGIPADSITVVPNAVDTDAFVPTTREAGLAAEIGIAPDETVLGYISSFATYEGISFLIEAVARLVRRGHRVRALLVGDGEERERLKAQARSLGIEDRVHFTGSVPHTDILRYYGLIDVFVVPRTPDRVSQLVTPLKPYEAMAAGRAVVVSDVAALREMVIPGETGLTFRAGDAAHLSVVAESLVRQPEQRAALGRAAREWVCRHRTWSQNGERYAALMNSLPGAAARQDSDSLSPMRSVPAHRSAAYREVSA
jgi:glycosyltransferase involved in cell wall biosynthesis/predicted glycoside hydrolase/deacetylase ChbG (UPF0249 family)